MNLLQLHELGETPLPHEGEAPPAIGIDLGTTHSVVAISHEGKVEILRDAMGRTLQPSVLHFDETGVNVGWDAKAKWQQGEGVTLASVKRHMHEAAAVLKLGHRGITPVEASAAILRHMKALAEHDLGKEITDAVITVPAYFDDTARTATKDAAQLAGMNVLRLVNEPTAAALAYGLDSGAEGIYAVYDLGGGTFDISILKLEKGVFQVLSTGGDTQLGGDDFDREIALYLRHDASGKGMAQARCIKEQLTETEASGGLTRTQFETLIAPYISRTLAICETALSDAGVSKADVRGVVLVGGSTRIPYVREQAGAFFGKEPLTDINPDEVVAAGAALQAEALSTGSGALLLDVIPLSLGLETMGGLTEKLIWRNTPIPASVSQEFTTYQDNQTGMVIHVLQGEREMVADNRSLARFTLSGIPALPAGIARVKVTFSVDADGVLSVSAEETQTGVRQAVHVKPSYGLEPEDIERMLLISQENAKQDIMQRLDREAKVEAMRALAEIESALASDGHLLSDAERKLLEMQMNYVREAVEEGDRERIDAEIQQLGHAAAPLAERRMNQAVAKVLSGCHVDAVKL